MTEAMVPVERIDDEHCKRTFTEVGRLVAGRVVRAARQPRWRPAWFLEVDCDGEIVPVFFRGDRGMGSGRYDIRYEYDVMKVLEDHGIPVPRLYGFCEDPRGIVMARAPGRPNLATAENDDTRRAVLDDYVDILARMHGIDLGAFHAIGLRPPKDAEGIGLDDLPVWEKGFRKSKKRPDPLIELALLWLKRNVPKDRTRTTFVTGDPAQFLFDGREVTAVLDFELSHLGDPLGDLAGFRGRDVSEPLGDITRAYRRYAELTGEELDANVLAFHSVRFSLNTPLAVAALCAEPFPGLNLPQYLSWYLVFGRLAIETIADVEGIELEAPSLPEPVETRSTGLFDVLAASLKGSGENYSAETALRMVQIARERDRRGAAVEQEDLDRISRLVGRRVGDWESADHELERLVLEDDRSRDEELIRCIHHRTMMQELLLRPAMRELPNLEFQKVRI